MEGRLLLWTESALEQERDRLLMTPPLTPHLKTGQWFWTLNIFVLSILRFSLFFFKLLFLLDWFILSYLFFINHFIRVFCLHICKCIMFLRYTWRWEKSIGSYGMGLCVTRCWGLTGSFEREKVALLSHDWVISPALVFSLSEVSPNSLTDLG